MTVEFAEHTYIKKLEAEIERLKEDNRRHCAAIMTTQIYMELEAEIERLKELLSRAYGYTTSADDLLPEEIRAAIARKEIKE